ncbi:MAG: DUF421 domain-containing protein [Clostridia bacterium]|nr:DUF421 domain-containing protein [Clostridia bacterium]
MEKWFDASLTSLAAIALSAVGIYISVIVFTRIAGKRSFSSISSFDFAMTVAVGSIIASTVLSESVSLLQGIAGLAALYLLQIAAALLRRYKILKKAIDNSPHMLMRDGKIFEDNLRSSRLTVGDLRSKLRAAGVRDPKQVEAMVFETTGDISIILKDQNIPFDSWMLNDVKQP